MDITVAAGFTEAVEHVKEALAAQGFGVLTEIDVAAVMKARLDVQMPPYLILGACMPSLAHRAMEVDPSIGLLLPCNVVLRAVDADTTLVQVADPELLMQVADVAQLHPIAAEAKARLRAAMDNLRTYDKTSAQMATVRLNPAELQLLKHALHSFLTDFGHDEADVHRSIRNLSAKLAAVATTSADNTASAGSMPAPSNGEPCLTTIPA
jgi:uncharacterized protein (DUF302 family)